jgi:anti-sigma factor RsiW
VNDNPNNAMTVRCEEIESLAILYACDELDPTVRAALEKHTAQCASCAEVVAHELRLHQAVAALDQPADSLDPSGLLLSQCRSELAEALDDQQARANQPGWRAVFSPLAWWKVFRDTLVCHPAMSMAVLVVMGFFAGVAGQKLRVPPAATSAHAVMTISATPKLTDQQLQSAGSANVAWVTPAGSATPTVQVQLMSQMPTSIEGSPEDADIERALTFVLQNGQRFDSGARLDSLDVLRTQAADPEVRRALCAAARSDQNPGVRMKALDALQGYENDAMVRQTLLDALQGDDNSGVRVSAVNLLVNSLEANGESGTADPRIVAVLRDRLRNDPNNYIRLQSSAALRALGSGDLP